jgi:Arc/MetJ family transcription regulator
MDEAHSAGFSVRRTVVIDDALLHEAQRALGTKSIRATIERSLKETIRQRRLRDFAEALGTFEMAMTREDLLEQRRREAGEVDRGDALAPSVETNPTQRRRGR